MKTVFINMKTGSTVETVDSFTPGEDSPASPKEFRAYVREMVREYHLAGMPVYRSSRSTNEWKNK